MSPPVRETGEARLVEVVGTRPGRKHAPARGLLFGRSPECDVVFDETEISRRHCRVLRRAERYRIEDLGSRNGTFVNGERVEGVRDLSFGDRIQIGGTVLLLVHHDPLRDALLQRQKMEALGQLGAGVAHDLNNLLGVLTSTLQHVSELDPELTLGADEVRVCHEDLFAAVRSATAMTRRLVAFARRAGTPDGTDVDVSHLSDEVVRLVRRTCPRTIRIRTRIEPALTVRAEPGELHRVLMNLCINARDAMPEGGELRIEASAADAASVPDAPFAAGQRLVHLSVSDTGVGMDEPTRERIFEPFFTTKAGPSGTGLGLSAVYEIVTSHGGHLAVDSTPGRGSTFHVYLPGGTSAAAELPGDATRARLHDTGERTHRVGRVLLVDDQALVRRAAARLLRTVGHEVVTASGGAQALEIYRAGDRPDVVILDLDMPAMTGDECWQRLRAVDSAVRVLFLSGSCDDERRRRLVSEGARGFLGKPVDVQELRDAVQQAML